MSDPTTIPVRALCPAAKEATDLLAAVLVARADVETSTVAAEAILVLDELHPPLRTLVYPRFGMLAADCVPRVLAAVVRALEEAAVSGRRRGHAAAAARHR